MSSYSSSSSAAALRLPGGSGSSPNASPRISPTSTAPFSFPSTATAPIPPPLPSSSSARFNAAFSSSAFNHNGGGPSRHATQSSISSLASETDGFRGYPDEIDSPTSREGGSTRAFDALQRELGGPEGARGLGLTSEGEFGAQGRGFGGYSSAAGREMGRLYEEPEEYDTVRGMPNGRYGAADEAQYRPDASTSSRYGAGGNGDASGLGRPASIALDQNDNSMSFLLAPPPSFDSASAASKQFAAAAAVTQHQSREKERERTGRERIFPAPLLLKGDRSYSMSGADRNGGAAGAGGAAGLSSPVFPPVQPLSIPRRPSTTASSAASQQSTSGSTTTSPAQTHQRSWARDRGGEREGPMNPPDGSHSRLAYHRRQQSSTSSLSHGSYLPYNNSYSYSYEPRHQPTASTSTSSTASPSVGSGRNAQAFPTPSTSSSVLPTTAVHAPSSSTASASTTAATSPEPPISAQALHLHILALRSASSPMALSQSQGPLSRSGTPLYSASSAGAGLANHQRIRSASSTTSADPDGAGSTVSISSALTAGTGSNDRDGARSPSRVAGARLDTVDLSHKRIADVPVEVVDELKDEVEKLALGYNLLKDLPPYFSGLGNRLKYLNVRVNMLTTFPAVLCEMPSIEILDISRNKIRKLPQNPGTLLNLKVFSIAKNRIKRLPVWFTSMSHLKVLKLDHNPLEWPPKEVATFTASISGQPMTKQEEADEMQRWLPALMKWMKENREREIERERAREVEKRRRPSLAIEHISEDERGSFDERRPNGITRTESGRLNESLSRSTRTTPALPSIDLPSVTEDSSSSSSTAAMDPSVRHSRNASHSTTQSLAPSPRPGLRGKKSLPDLRQSHADILAERRTGTTLEEEPPQPVVPSLEGPLKRLQEEGKHPRLVHSSSARAALPTQQSTPASSAPSSAPPPAETIVRSMSARPVPTISPPATQSRQGTAPLPHQPQPPRPKLDLDAPSTSKGKGGAAAAAAAGAAGDFDRNSGAYFRRLSMLPVSTISKAVPAALLQFADAIRGILFSLSQIYTALRQFVVFASQDRLPAPVARLMGTADIAMSSLINALDRFDSLSRRGTPPQGIVRDVFTACRDNVTVFGKLVGALQPQLKALTATADARYTRTLLLMLYGSMGEIATSWSAVAPFFADDDQSSAATLVLQPPTPSPQMETSTTSPPEGGSGSGSRLTRQRSTTRRHAGSFSVEDVQLGAVLPPADIPPVPALPFAMEDGGLSTSTSTTPSEFNPATLRARPPLSAKGSAASATSSNGSTSFLGRAPPPGSLAMPPQLGYEEMAQKAFEHPVTPGVQGLFDRTVGTDGSRAPSRAGSFSAPPGQLPPSTMSASTSGGFPISSSSSSVPPLPASTQPMYRPHRESRPVSTLNADETFIDQAESTMAIASDVYGMLLDAFVDDARVAEQFMTISSGRRKLKELTALCEAGNEVTGRLGRAVERVRGSDGRGRLKFLQTDAAELGTAAFDYVQNVIRTAKLMKAVSQELAFPQPLKDAVGQLTLGTREFARLLSHGHTSFRPQTSRGGGAGTSIGGPGGGSGPPLEALPEVRSRDFA